MKEWMFKFFLPLSLQYELTTLTSWCCLPVTSFLLILLKSCLNLALYLLLSEAHLSIPTAKTFLLFFSLSIPVTVNVPELRPHSFTFLVYVFTQCQWTNTMATGGDIYVHTRMSGILGENTRWRIAESLSWYQPGKWNHFLCTFHIAPLLKLLFK